MRIALYAAALQGTYDDIYADATDMAQQAEPDRTALSERLGALGGLQLFLIYMGELMKIAFTPEKNLPGFFPAVKEQTLQKARARLASSDETIKDIFNKATEMFPETDFNVMEAQVHGILDWVGDLAFEDLEIEKPTAAPSTSPLNFHGFGPN